MIEAATIRLEQIVGRVHVEGERPVQLHVRCAAGPGSRRVGGPAARPNRKPIASGGDKSNAFVPVPCRSGTRTTTGRSGASRSAILAASTSRSISRAVIPGKSTGSTTTAVASAPAATLASPRPSLSPSVACSRDIAPIARARRRRSGSIDTTTTPDRHFEASADTTVRRSMARISSARSSGSSGSPRRDLPPLSDRTGTSATTVERSAPFTEVPPRRASRGPAAYAMRSRP